MYIVVFVVCVSVQLCENVLIELSECDIQALAPSGFVLPSLLSVSTTCHSMWFGLAGDMVLLPSMLFVVFYKTLILGMRRPTNMFF